MKKLFFIACIVCALANSLVAQQTLKLGYFNKIPTAIKDCGALYTYDTVALTNKKYILLTDFQNLGLIMVGGKQVKLQLKDTRTTDQTSISIYSGGGYSVVLSATTTGTKGKLDLESGTLQVTKGVRKLRVKIHGQSGCDESNQEGNGN
jgi:hypothetical protein